MVNVLKVYFKCEIRRVAINSYYMTQYNALCEKVIELFPCLDGKTFILGWKDEEGDSIVMSSDNELAQAVANATELMKIYVHQTEEVPQNDTPSGPTTRHICVKCDGCNADIYGYRYKCLQCKDFDLCHACNVLDKHPTHDMLKMALPSNAIRYWSFLGRKRLWSSMFGLFPGRGTACGGGTRNGHCGMPGRVTPNAEDKSSEQFSKCAETGQEFLHAVGASVANLLDAFGVDVKVYVDPSSESQQQPSPTEKQKPETEKTESDTAKESSPVEAMPEASAEPQTVVKTAQEVFMETQAKQDPEPVSDQKGNGARPKTTLGIYPDLGSNSEDSSEQVLADLLKRQVDKVAASFKSRGFQEEEKFTKMIAEQVQRIADGIANPDADQNIPSLNAVREEAEKFAARLRRHQQDSSATDGWTIVNSETTEENTIPKEAVAMPAESSATVATASQSETVKVDQQAATVQPSAPEQRISANSAENTSSEPLDPAVESALELMLSMGYNNDGGWLIRLLKNKHGNINETLDSLYK